MGGPSHRRRNQRPLHPHVRTRRRPRFGGQGHPHGAGGLGLRTAEVRWHQRRDDQVGHMTDFPTPTPSKLGSTWCSAPTAVWSSGTTQTSRSHGVLLTAVMPWPAMSRPQGRSGEVKVDEEVCSQFGNGALAHENQPATGLAAIAGNKVYVLCRRCHIRCYNHFDSPVVWERRWKLFLRVDPWSRKKTATSPSLARGSMRSSRRPAMNPAACCLDSPRKLMVRSLPTTAAPCCFTMLKMACCVWSAGKMAA